MEESMPRLASTWDNHRRNRGSEGAGGSGRYSKGSGAARRLRVIDDDVNKLMFLKTKT